ncbi:MAG: hypothetical protein AB7O49_06395 [Sphingomonadales bacterium]
MPTKRGKNRSSRSAARWSADPPLDRYQPQGPEACLNEALELLGPFEFETIEDHDVAADKLVAEHSPGPLKDDDLWVAGLLNDLSFPWHSREEARKAIEEIALDYLRNTDVKAAVPTPAAVLGRLKKLQLGADALRRQLHEADQYVHEALWMAWKGRSGDDRDALWHYWRTQSWVDPVSHKDVFESLLGDELAPHLPRWSLVMEHLTMTLSELSALASSGAELFEVAWVGDEGKSQGRRSNLFRKRFGDPKWRLAGRCWHLFEECKPGTASGTEGGPFFLFVGQVLEYATGIEMDCIPNVHNIVGSYVGVANRHGAVQERISQLVDALDEPVDASVEGALRAELAPLTTELDQLRFELDFGRERKAGKFTNPRRKRSVGNGT